MSLRAGAQLVRGAAVEYGEVARVWGIGLLDTKAYAKERHEDKSGSVV
ncbi:hypothetical protein BH09ACT7_BH09ACT7_56110 [soil metagenome]